MILFEKDWYNTRAIVDMKTNNRTFINYAAKLKKMGIKNHLWPLALFDESLQGIDVRSDNLSLETRLRVMNELSINPVYYFREVAGFAGSGGETVKFEANRLSMSAIWLFFNHITYFAIAPRQHGKTGTFNQIYVYCTYLGNRQSKISVVTQNIDLRKKNVNDLKECLKEMPEWLRNAITHKNDADNTEFVNSVNTGNFVKFYVGNRNEDIARKSGRGTSTAIRGFDEVAYVDNIATIYPVAMASGDKATEQAKRAGAWWSTVISTTAGMLDSPSGSYSKSLYDGGYLFNEVLYDTDSLDELTRLVETNSSSRTALVSATFSHRQLGVTDEDFLRRVRRANGTKEEIERDYFNIWTSGGMESPIPPHISEIIHQNRVDPSHIVHTSSKYELRWYYDENLVYSKIEQDAHILSIDTSDAQGQDNCSGVMLNLTTMEVAMTTSVNATNLLHYGLWLGDMMIEFPTLTLLVERASSGATIIDIVTDKLLTAGINPYKRVYNKIVSEQGVKDEVYRDELCKNNYIPSQEHVTKYKAYMGLKPNMNTRTLLYSQVFDEAITTVGHLIRDERLINELTNLVRKDGRIDHTKDGHDDSVIAWLMGHWFARYASNIDYYGIRPSSVLSKVIPNGTTVTEADYKKAEDHAKIRTEISNLEKKVESNMGNLKAELYTRRLKRLEELSTIKTGEIVTRSAIEEIKARSKPKKISARERLGIKRSDIPRQTTSNNIITRRR